MGTSVRSLCWRASLPKSSQRNSPRSIGVLPSGTTTPAPDRRRGRHDTTGGSSIDFCREPDPRTGRVLTSLGGPWPGASGRLPGGRRRRPGNYGTVTPGRSPSREDGPEGTRRVSRRTPGPAFAERYGRRARLPISDVALTPVGRRPLPPPVQHLPELGGGLRSFLQESFAPLSGEITRFEQFADRLHAVDSIVEITFFRHTRTPS